MTFTEFAQSDQNAACQQTMVCFALNSEVVRLFHNEPVPN